jgi:hypothetical protein
MKFEVFEMFETFDMQQIEWYNIVPIPATRNSSVFDDLRRIFGSDFLKGKSSIFTWYKVVQKCVKNSFLIQNANIRFCFFLFMQRRFPVPNCTFDWLID